nr:RNA-directed DNA polymerase, eukaryota [Tanacetum cinerariifolium]
MKSGMLFGVVEKINLPVPMVSLSNFSETLIPKSLDPKFMNEFRPISLIGSIYKVITKILQNSLSLVIADLISDVQSAYLPNWNILDAYDSIRWDYLIDVLHSFGFGAKWRSWIRGCLTSSMACILVNGSPTSEFQFHRGLKQGDPLAPYLFILVMESLHLSFTRSIDAGMFTRVMIDSSVIISHLFYADDAVFIGEWSQKNFKVMKAPFKYLGVNVGGNSALVKSWDETINKLRMRLSKWKLKTLSIGG